MIDLNISFMAKATLAGCGIATLTGPLGSFLVWRRMAYFGDTLAHSTLLGIAIAFILNVHIYLGLGVMCLLVSATLVSFKKTQGLANDTILSTLSHSFLALGLLVVSLLPGFNFQVLSLLYGDILSVSDLDLIIIFIFAPIILGIIYYNWQKMLMSTIHEELAEVEGINVKAQNWLLVLLLSLTFAFSINLIGVLLISALLIIPAASARVFTTSPKEMVLLSILISIVSVILGMMSSFHFDLPCGPAIVSISSLIFLCSVLLKRS